MDNVLKQLELSIEKYNSLDNINKIKFYDTVVENINKCEIYIKNIQDELNKIDPVNNIHEMDNTNSDDSIDKIEKEDNDTKQMLASSENLKKIKTQMENGTFDSYSIEELLDIYKKMIFDVKQVNEYMSKQKLVIKYIN